MNRNDRIMLATNYLLATQAVQYLKALAGEPLDGMDDEQKVYLRNFQQYMEASGITDKRTGETVEDASEGKS